MMKDNLLRRQMDKRQEYLVIAELSKLYEKGRGGDRGKNQYGEYESAKDLTVSSLTEDDVIDRTSKETGKSKRTTTASAVTMVVKSLTIKPLLKQEIMTSTGVAVTPVIQLLTTLPLLKQEIMNSTGITIYAIETTLKNLF